MTKWMHQARLLLVAVVAGSLAACATPGYVDEKIAAAEQRQAAVDYAQNTQIAELDKKFVDVLERANSKLAELGDAANLSKVAQSFTVQYPLGSASVPEQVKPQIAEIAASLLTMGKPYFIEIQGHTDTTGPARVNERVAASRAEAVRRVLHENGIPLRSMSAISFAATRPLVEETTAADRQTNRRVEILIMQ